MTHAMLSGLIRMAQGLALASPTLLVGLLVAGVFRYYLTPAQLRKLFGGETLASLPISWLIGMLLPVCSIGVLPILMQMHRARVRPGAMTAFALSAPLFNPLSLLYGLTLSRPIVVTAFALCSLAVVTLLGTIWDRFAARGGSDSAAKEEEEDEPSRVIGVQRLLAMIVMITREAVGFTGVLVLVALLGLGLLGAFLPYGALQNSFEMDDVWAPARMTFLAIPIYATPMLAMSQLGMMFQHCNSPGAALALLLLGTGVNLATLVWLVKKYGFKSTLVWFTSLVLIVLALSYAVEKPLTLPGAEPAGHTHAFDGYATPLHSKSEFQWAIIREALVKPLSIAEFAAVSVLSGLVALGLLFRLLRIHEERFHRDAAQSIGTYDRIVPAPLLAGVVLLGLIAFSVVACFAYYPHPSESLEEIASVRSEVFSAARSGNAEQALHWIGLWDDWSRRLEVATFLRSGHVRPYQRMQGYIVRKKLELLEHELEEEPLDQKHVNAVLMDLLESDNRWRTAFRPAKIDP
jgi:uncharacterized protein